MKMSTLRVRRIPLKTADVSRSASGSAAGTSGWAGGTSDITSLLPEIAPWSAPFRRQNSRLVALDPLVHRRRWRGRQQRNGLVDGGSDASELAMGGTQE